MGLMWFLGFRDTNLKSPLQLFFHSQTHISNSKSYLLAWKVFKFECKSHKIYALSVYLSRVSRIIQIVNNPLISTKFWNRINSVENTSSLIEP